MDSAYKRDSTGVIQVMVNGQEMSVWVQMKGEMLQTTWIAYLQLVSLQSFAFLLHSLLGRREWLETSTSRWISLPLNQFACLANLTLTKWQYRPRWRLLVLVVQAAARIIEFGGKVSWSWPLSRWWFQQRKGRIAVRGFGTGGVTSWRAGEASYVEWMLRYVKLAREIEANLVKENPEAVDWRRLTIFCSHSGRIARRNRRVLTSELWKMSKTRIEYWMSFWVLSKVH